METSFVRLPRRNLIGGGLAAVAFGRCALAQSEPGFEPLPAQVKIKDNQLTTPVWINDQGPFRFVIDTGADHSVIAEDVAKALQLPAGDTVKVQGIIRAVAAPSVPVSALRFGPVVRRNLMLPVLPHDQLKADGFLGLDVIGNNRVEFDFAKQTLRVVESGLHNPGKPAAANDTLIHAPGESGHLRAVACVVEGVFATAFIDTGAEVSVGNGALHRALMAKGPDFRGDRGIELTGITGGVRNGTVVKVETILLGNLEFTGCEIAIADLDVFGIWGLSENPALLIGLNYLRAFETVAIDYGTKEFRLKLASSGWVNKKRG